jgi:hypothetical protein
MAKKKKKAASRKPNLFKESSKQKGFKAAKKALLKAKSKAKAAWKKAITTAKKKIKRKK